ncbi:MAG: type 1 glutamine amidotransferase [Planctomycetes bacterium]|nr:type 1 glutamine amidotransferase [Planctomycetota bacterium]
MNTNEGIRVAVLVEQDYQDLEVWYPLLRMREAGCVVTTVGSGTSGKYHGKYGYPVEADTDVSKVTAADFDAVIIPGGWAPDFMRRVPGVISFVAEANRAGKVIAAICHAGWVLASAGVARGRTVTSFFAIADDLRNAGAEWVDREVVVDGNLITARKPDDLPAFCKAILAALGAAG